MTNVTFRYQGDGTSSPDSLTSTNFHTYYKGGEMVVAGRIPEVASFMDYEIVALQGDEPYRVKGRHRNTQVKGSLLQKKPPGFLPCKKSSFLDLFFCKNSKPFC